MILAPFFIAVVPFANLLSLIQWATGKRPSPNLALVLLLCILVFFPRFGFYHWVDLTALRGKSRLKYVNVFVPLLRWKRKTLLQLSTHVYPCI